MSSASAALLLDDGDLNEVGMLLWQMNVDLSWVTGDEIRGTLPRPRELLITNKRRALQVHHLIPNLGDPAPPVWVCFHHKDFTSLREILRELGAHYLVQAGSHGADAHLLRILFSQLRYRGSERRQHLRLPCGCEVTCSDPSGRFTAHLVDLAEDSCRVEADRQVRVGTELSIYLPPELDPAAPQAYTGVVLRTAPLPEGARRRAAIVVAFNDDEVRRKVARILAGQGIGTRIVPLCPPPARSSDTKIRVDQRTTTRYRYRQRVACLRSVSDPSPRVIAAHDLSLSGIRLEDQPDLTPGQHVIIGLGRGRGKRPLLVEGTVLPEKDGVEGIAVAFDALDDDRRAELLQILGGLEALSLPTHELRDTDIILLGDALLHDAHGE